MAVALEKIYHDELDDMPGVSRARRRTEWFSSQKANFDNVLLALRSVGHGVFYDFRKANPKSLPSEFIGKGQKLEGGVTLDTTTHTLRGSSRLKEALKNLRKTLQVGDEVIEEDGRTIRLDQTDIEDIRALTPRGLKLLELITDRGPVTTSATQTATTTNTTGQATQTTPATTKPPVRTTATQAPVQVRMTRGAIRALREANTAEEERRRKRVARALAQLAI